jgi:succinate dehydrogenase / fumarate reductase, iron-sulfur subunit
VVIRPLPGLPVVRDLVVDMTQFYTKWEKVKPFLRTRQAAARPRAPAVAGRTRQAGWPVRVHPVRLLLHLLPVVLVEPGQVHRPGRLLQAYRFLADSRDTATDERLSNLDDAFSVFRCHGIMNCVNVCPKA